MKVFRKIISLLVIVLTLAGTTGFTMMEHDCIHCGSDISLLFNSNYDTDSDCCETPVEASCCSASESIAPESCSLSGEDCCSYSTVDLEISDPVQMVSSDNGNSLSAEVTSLRVTPGPSSNLDSQIVFRQKLPDINLHIRYSCFLT